MRALRGHHLVCLNFFSGEGYSSDFVDNLKNVLRDAVNMGVEVCTGADDVCRMCPYLIEGECREESEIRRLDEAALLLLNLVAGECISWKDVKARLLVILPEWHDRYCGDCGWIDVCRKDEQFQECISSRGN